MKAIDIAKVVADYYKIDLDTFLKSKSRKNEIKTPRHFARVLIKENTRLTLKEVAKVFGNTDHTTVLNSYDYVKGIEFNKQEFQNYLRINFTVQTLKYS